MSNVNQTYESQIQPSIQEIQNNENTFEKIGIAIPENVAQNIPQNSLSIVVTTPQQLSPGPPNLTYAQMAAPQNNDKGKFSYQRQLLCGGLFCVHLFCKRWIILYDLGFLILQNKPPLLRFYIQISI